MYAKVSPPKIVGINEDDIWGRVRWRARKAKREQG